MNSVQVPINWILRVEGLAVLITAIIIYSQLGFSWLMFALLFLVPDVSLLAYLLNNRMGAVFYNAAHSYVGALGCLGCGYFMGVDIALLLGLIWLAHIGFDRALGYGLKYPNGFRYTHLGIVGKPSKE